MNYFDKPKVLGTIIIGLFLLNLGTLTFMWVNKPRPPLPPEFVREGPPPNASEFLIHELKMTEAQQKDYEKLRDEHRSQQKNIHEEIGKTRDELFKMLSTVKPDTLKANQLAAKVGDLEKQVQTSTFAHFTKVKALLDDSQKKKFDDIIGEALKMMAPPIERDNANRPPPPDGRRPPPDDRRPPPGR